MTSKEDLKSTIEDLWDKRYKRCCPYEDILAVMDNLKKEVVYSPCPLGLKKAREHFLETENILICDKCFINCTGHNHGREKKER